MKNEKGTAATRAKRKYNAANYDEIRLSVPKGNKATYKAIAEALGISLSQFMVKAVEEKIEREALLDTQKDDN